MKNIKINKLKIKAITIAAVVSVSIYIVLMILATLIFSYFNDDARIEAGAEELQAEKAKVYSCLQDTGLYLSKDSSYSKDKYSLYYDLKTDNIYIWNGDTSIAPQPYLDSTGLKPFKYNNDTKEIYEETTDTEKGTDKND